jgi:hypothetical protein
MKMYSLTDPVHLVNHEGVLSSQYAVAAIAAVEMALGLWLAIDGKSPVCWGAATAAFLLFLVVALGKAFSGETDCGCFGTLHISPWWTSILDAFALTLLLITGKTAGMFREALSLSRVRRSIIMFSACLAVAAILAAGMSFVATAQPTERAGIHQYDDMTVVDPGEWPGGTPFPLLADIDVGDQLAQGQWTVLLVHHDCPSCLAILDRVQENEMPTVGSLAVVEVPPLGQMSPAGECLMGRLAPDRDWFVPTPTRIDLNDGLVTAVESDLD